MNSLYQRRIVFLSLAASSIALGLLIRSPFSHLSPFFSKYAGDATWAALILFLFAAITPLSAPLRIASLALSFCFAIEFSQLYQAPWILSLRTTTLGHLILGQTFNPPDLIAYTIGVLIATAIYAATHPNSTPQP